MTEVTKKVRLANGVEMPTIGYGTWQVENSPAGAGAVEKAIQAGYRHIDGAARYENEKSVGEGIRMSGIAREELFVTSKVWFTHRSYEKVLEACDATLKDLGLDYVDLYLIHWPAVVKNYENWEEVNAETWRAMENIYRAGKARAIGVSNFLPQHLEPLLKTAKITPMVNQIEFRPGYPQTECAKWCMERGILPEAWRPLWAGAALTGELMTELSEKYGFLVNIDLIAGLEAESAETFASGVEKAVETGADNITVHCLSLKSGAKMKEEINIAAIIPVLIFNLLNNTPINTSSSRIGAIKIEDNTSMKKEKGSRYSGVISSIGTLSGYIKP